MHRLYPLNFKFQIQFCLIRIIFWPRWRSLAVTQGKFLAAPCTLPEWRSVLQEYAFCMARFRYIIYIIYLESQDALEVREVTHSLSGRSPTWLMWLWWVRILTRDLTRGALGVNDTRVAKTCQPCQPVGANFSRPVLNFAQGSRKNCC